MIGSIIEVGLKLIDKVIPDPVEREKAKVELMKQEQAGALQEIKASMNVIMSEANGESWLQRNWRPVTMLVFVGLVVAKWLGLTVDGISESVELELMNLIQIGIGGYIFSRGCEKAIKEYKK